MMFLTSFEWYRSEKGYLVRPIRELMPNGTRPSIEATTILTHLGSIPEEPSDLGLVQIGDGLASYFPLNEHKGLFREFVQLGSDVEKIRRFANEYGFLYSAFDHQYPIESIRSWFVEIHKMSLAANLLPDQNKRDTSSEIVEFINNWILPDRIYRFSYALHHDDETEGISMHFEPVNLISAMWLQLASAATGDQVFKECPECPHWFPIAPGDGRPEKRFCSDRCRLRAYRKRESLKVKRSDKPSIGHQKR